MLLPDFDYGLTPPQLTQTAIYADERLRARRAVLAKMPYAAARTSPFGSAHTTSSPKPRVAPAKPRPVPAAAARGKNGTVPRAASVAPRQPARVKPAARPKARAVSRRPARKAAARAKQ